MALNLNDRYPGKTTPADGAYPFGSMKNVTSVGANDGTQLEKDWANDIFGFLQSLLVEGSVYPNGVPDQVGASDYLSALKNIITNGTSELTRYSILTHSGTTGSWGSPQHMTYTTFTNASSITATMQAPVAPFGDTVVFEKGVGAGDIAVIGAAGVTVEVISGGTNVIDTEGQVATLVSKNATTWRMIK